MQSNPSHQKPKLTVEVKYGLDPESYVVLTDRFIRDKRVIFVVYAFSTPLFNNDNMIHVQKLGQGMGGSVWLCRFTKTNEYFAVKELSYYTKEKRNEMEKEITILGSIDSEYLVQYYGAYIFDDLANLVIEYMDKGSLASLISKSHGMPIQVVAAIAYQVLQGLKVLQVHQIIHRDLKPANILLNSYGEVKISDFGLSRDIQQGNTANTVIGTYYYMSPERTSSLPYDYRADIWSLGVVLLECIRGYFPFPNVHTNLDIQLTYQDDVSVYFNDLNFSVVQFLQSIFIKDYHKRPNATLLLGSDFFKYYHIRDRNDCLAIIQNYLQMYHF